MLFLIIALGIILGLVILVFYAFTGSFSASFLNLGKIMLFILGYGTLVALFGYFFIKIVFFTFFPWIINHLEQVALSFCILVLLFIVIGLIRIGNAQRRKRQ